MKQRFCLEETETLFGQNKGSIWVKRGYIRMKKRLCRDKTKAIFGTNKRSVRIKKILFELTKVVSE